MKLQKDLCYGSEDTRLSYQLIPPPPIPAIARAMTNAHKLVAAPQRNDPIKNTMLANNKADLRPKTSEIRPSMFYMKKQDRILSSLLSRHFNMQIIIITLTQRLQSCKTQHVRSGNPNNLIRSTLPRLAFATWN